ncbi:hypothetical protein ABD81_16340 [Bacillus thuringiensis]|uniref:Alpha/beta hydrolase n=1 Tax=Bacillus wiedmannii TaxID=1890302 RepID=A0A242Z084_9BACI|nr:MULTISPECIES: hypothetical protein [Bacillus cereus group]MBG9747803.1 hypothetical protein [Bacillus thuringiensis]MBG9747824.1 hypothetical protein [Bacillus thuringiensis]MBG9749337.1 hypothetical protein [Bacillus thuringiensis]MBG9753079.1 hypothetical protein [Bacillus thuringiensis]MBG9776379.1 hypothetical protein [Bacillus thuringiensis]
MKIYPLDIESSIPRMKVEIPKEAKGICILVSSGQMGRFDKGGAEGEQEFYSALFSILPSLGYGVIQPDMPLRDDINSPASTGHILERELWLKKCLASSLLSTFNWNQIVLLGVSLGGRVILNNLDRFYAGIILVGCVIDSEISNAQFINNVHLLYGSHDYIAYMDGSGNVSPISPEEYRWTSLNFLKEAGVNERQCTILKGYGHTLAEREKSEDDPIHIVTSIIKNWIE